MVHLSQTTGKDEPVIKKKLVGFEVNLDVCVISV